MAEWFKRSTVNTFYRGSIPLKTYKNKYCIVPRLCPKDRASQVLLLPSACVVQRTTGKGQTGCAITK